MLTAAEHRTVQAQSKANRAHGASARRRAPAQVVRVQDGERVLLVAISRSAPGVGYLLRPDTDGRLTCTCAGYGWRGRCAHVEAA